MGWNNQGCLICGAGRGNRTPTSVKKLDFELGLICAGTILDRTRIHNFVAMIATDLGILDRSTQLL